MKVSVIGSGNMGSALVKHLVAAGHDVLVVGRDEAKAQALAVAEGATAVSATGIASADIIINATAFADAVEALNRIPGIEGKIVVDISNPLTADYMGLTIGHETSAAEEIAKAVPGVTLVKAFNTLLAQVLAAGPKIGEATVPVFVATDDAHAKAKVTELATSMGFAVVDAGGLKNARYLEPLAGFNVFLAYGAGHGVAIAPSWLGVA
ncbi:NADPH-dependent F420 reductase [Asticcacaulis excentricus]|uniref:NADP oxidoreductase coenzyme F420-dependent n=1 Tax=Asticcacaulis excentricus (strain ATCC 15261 / DSM 4724 / KCTC 12464 / NCIMB 9791 / VKM B-1370 / CB 48) TaxID=573065 RepID=E8RUR5_ASTEC|nr:NAD(P)-binding domain-containing protein [Asticcacaulis excentricus]ADU14115.1 NADP oxidoreductase coenzyme F420-dependent [Asticcacaulis excentricus CB 48]